MIPEEYVTFETAKLLREAGFPQIQQSISLLNALNKVGEDASFFNQNLWRDMGLPTQDQAMRWLRGQGLIVIVDVEYYEHHIKEAQYRHIVYTDDVRSTKRSSFVFSNHESAAEAGIQAACRYLIDHFRDSTKMIEQ